jgi:hypothetical protein
MVAIGCSGAPREALTETELVEACDSLTQVFMSALKSELRLALEEGGPEFAVAVCSEMAPEIAREYSSRLGWEIRRISTRPRNPDNTPTPDEAALLERLTAQSAPPLLYEWMASATGDSTFVFAKPIRVAAVCLSCHGAPERFDPGLVDVLKEHYPVDQATGYQEGDLRGAFVVSVDMPLGAEALRPAHP